MYVCTYAHETLTYRYNQIETSFNPWLEAFDFLYSSQKQAGSMRIPDPLLKFQTRRAPSFNETRSESMRGHLAWLAGAVGRQRSRS